MFQSSNRAWLGVAALAFALSACLTGLPSARAQDAPPQPDVAAPEAPEPPEPPKEITSADFAVQASAVEERLSQIQAEMSVIDIRQQVNDALDEIDAQGLELREQFDALETRRMMISEINALRAQLELLDARTKRQIDKLSVYGAELEKLATQNEEDIEIWTKALRLVRRASMPKPVRDRTVSILHGLREGQKELDAKMHETLVIQSRALDVRDRVRGAEQAVVLAQRKQAEQIFKRQEPPLWSTATVFEGQEGEEAKQEGYGIRLSWPAMTSHLRTERGALLLELFLVLVFGWLLVRVRATLADRIGKRQEDAGIGWEDRAAEAVRHPWAAAILLALTSTRFVSPDRVVDMIILTWVVGLPVWFIVYKEMVPASFQRGLVGLGLLATIHIVVALVSGHPSIERALLLLELVLVSVSAGWLVRFWQTVELPKRTRQGLWFSVASFWTKIVLLLSLLGLGAAVLGYTYFAAESAAIAIMGTIAGTVAMALARIIEALISTSVHVGHLDAFRMIRANRDVTTRELGRVVRVAAVALFLWSLADMTSSWRPLGRVLHRVFTADLGFGLAETGVTFSDLVAFFFILWLSWVTARFVSFVLGEEVLPRLHMQPGVPYALTTFTRYAIIAIGFVAAVSMIGIPVDRLTIVLSALGVGIGFGLQGLVNNVVSGFVLLTERPIRMRDKVEVEGVLGNVSSIGIRASTIRTFDGAEVIVPNGDLISQRVVNWTLSARRQRVTIPVGVAYGTDPNQVLSILRRLAAENEKVFKSPAPLALFRGFGESSLDFELRIFMDPSDVLDVPSAVTVAINEALKEAGIEIPFPQRDLHLRGVPGGFALTAADTDTDTNR
jgi:small-conductance mechanosensitive channel